MIMNFFLDTAKCIFKVRLNEKNKGQISTLLYQLTLFSLLIHYLEQVLLKPKLLNLVKSHQ